MYRLQRWKFWTKIHIMAIVIPVCIYGGITSAEPLNYLLWFLMFLLVLLG